MASPNPFFLEGLFSKGFGRPPTNIALRRMGREGKEGKVLQLAIFPRSDELRYARWVVF